MFNKDMYALGSKRSSIRELFEYGKKRANEVGAENVFDFSLGNPNVPAPDCVKTLLSSLQTLAKPFTATLRRKATLPSEKRLQRIFLAVSA